MVRTTLNLLAVLVLAASAGFAEETLEAAPTGAPEAVAAEEAEALPDAWAEPTAPSQQNAGLEAGADTLPGDEPVADATAEVAPEAAGADVPVLSCSDLAVFKAFFNRTKDWADLEAMLEAGTLDVEAVVGVLARHLGAHDHRIERLLDLAAS